jgi:uncharacterized protein
VISSFLLIKLASSCNFDCTYCYWFRDPSVRKLPPVMPQDVVDQTLKRIREHIVSHELSEFVCSFHGGEPLLFGSKRFSKLLSDLETIGLETKCKMRFAITTNGSLIRDDWILLFTKHHVAVTVSIDGPPEVHDKQRLTVKGKPTWASAVEGYLSLCRARIHPSIIAVCDPTADARGVLNHLLDDLGCNFCDILIPDENHDASPLSISKFYIELFNEWYDFYADKGREVRILSEIVRGLMGLETRTDSIGYAPLQTMCLGPNGALEPHDVLRIAGSDKTRTACNIFDNSLGDLGKDSTWLAVRDASLSIATACKECRFLRVCGGGHLAQRWSKERGYDNPSVYCADLKQIFEHIEQRLSADIYA